VVESAGDPGAATAVRVPATCANLGPGFDCVALAVNLYDTVEVRLESGRGIRVRVEGLAEDRVPANRNNLAAHAAGAVLDRAGVSAGGLLLTIRTSIPVAGGLGSSAAAIVGGAVAANLCAGKPLDDQEILELTTSLEGHADNVAAALYGGVTIAARTPGGVLALRLRGPRPRPAVVVAVPDREVSTRRARRSLPRSVPFEDAAFSVERCALLVAALARGDRPVLRWAMEDRLHQPCRLDLSPGSRRALHAALEAGAFGAALSGSGPSTVALCAAGTARAVGNAMVDAFRAEGINADCFNLRISDEGALGAGRGAASAQRSDRRAAYGRTPSGGNST